MMTKPKRIWSLLGAVLFIAAVISISDSPKAPPAEPTAAKQEKATMALAKAIRAIGYDCQTIDSVVPYLSSKGYTVMCNHYYYSYQIEDHGGRWSINAD